MGNLIGSCAKLFIFFFPIKSHIDHFLRMLNAYAHGERLLLHVHARVAHELERVAGRMTARQHNAACGNQLGDGFGLGYLGLG